jgi:YVTN family beta-propeller protein
VTNVAVGDEPCSICTAGDKVFVANYRSDSISIIDLAAGNRVTNVPVERGPCVICVSGDKVSVANYNSASVSIIDLAAGNRVTNVPVGRLPCAICTTGDKVFVANELSDSISIIDLADENRVTNVPVGERPGAICTAEGKVLVANQLSGSISILTDTSASKQVLLLSAEPVTFSYPNPFNPECWMPVGKMEDEAGRMKVKVYNLLGQLVREIDCSNRSSGSNGSRVYWDGRDSRGLEVPAGVYFYEVAGEGVRRMMVLR